MGVGLGVGSTAVERNSYQELFLPSEFVAYANARDAKTGSPGREKPPQVEFVNGRVHDFGTMDRYAKNKHTFLLKNTGQGPLEVEVTGTTCKCTISGVDREKIPPGETGEIDVEWEAKVLDAATEFEQKIELSTNDPKNRFVSLIIKGYVVEPLRALPPKVVLGRVSTSETTTAEFRLFGAGTEAIEILGTEFQETETADLFDVAYDPMPQEELEKEGGASCGLLATLTVKPGLPLGPINQTIRVRARVNNKETEAQVSVKGQAVGDILIASSALYESRKNLLNFGALKRSESAKAVLQVFITGKHRHETELSVGEIDPPGYMKVDIGPAQTLNQGATIRHKVTVEIPAGQRPINRLSQLGEFGKLGRLVLETTHPTIEQISIRVRFAVD